ncbi:hypothetical protein LINPERHAP2_LOCUS30587 [Linum perenne]
MFPDQFRQFFQVRNCNVSVEDSRGAFGSDFRVSATVGEKSHFVFLDKGQLVWLRGILQEAAGKRWSLPISSSKESARRSLVVSHFVGRGVRNLKLTEVCKNGKLFFILIPWDPKSGGWRQLLLAIQPGSSAASLTTPARSFADVLRRPGLSEVGQCKVESVASVPCIRTEEIGVQDRLDFLKGCLVIRFSSPSDVDWTAFRRWAATVWGTSPELPYSRLADDLWLLDVSSEKEVDRIMALGKWRFGNILLHVDGWIKDAGRSTISSEKGVVWFLASGIPLHLRSPALFQALGDSCGSFLGFEKAGDLNSVRIKVKLQKEAPTSVTLKFGEEAFPVVLRLELEGTQSLVPRRSDAEEVPSVSGDSSSGNLVLSPQPPVFETVEAPSLSSVAVFSSEKNLELRASMCQHFPLIPRMTAIPSVSGFRGGSFAGLRLGSNEEPVSSSFLTPLPFRREDSVFLEASSSSPSFASYSQSSPSVLLTDEAQSAIQQAASSVEVEVLEVSELIGLTLNGSSAGGAAAAVATCKKIQLLSNFVFAVSAAVSKSV